MVINTELYLLEETRQFVVINTQLYLQVETVRGYQYSIIFTGRDSSWLSILNCIYWKKLDSSWLSIHNYIGWLNVVMLTNIQYN